MPPYARGQIVVEDQVGVYHLSPDASGGPSSVEGLQTPIYFRGLPDTIYSGVCRHHLLPGFADTHLLPGLQTPTYSGFADTHLLPTYSGGLQTPIYSGVCRGFAGFADTHLLRGFAGVCRHSSTPGVCRHPSTPGCRGFADTHLLRGSQTPIYSGVCRVCRHPSTPGFADTQGLQTPIDSGVCRVCRHPSTPGFADTHLLRGLQTNVDVRRHASDSGRPERQRASATGSFSCGCLTRPDDLVLLSITVIVDTSSAANARRCFRSVADACLRPGPDRR